MCTSIELNSTKQPTHCDKPINDNSESLIKKIIRIILKPFQAIAELFYKLFYCYNQKATPQLQSDEGIKLEYKYLLSEETYSQKSSLFEGAYKNFDRNRYAEILPNEPTRFKIANEPEFYFNANWVLGKKAIACQGPKKEEHAEFWKMVWESKSSSIVMLTNPLENGVDKCSIYWPYPSFFGSSSQYNEISVTNIKEEILYQDNNEKIVKRTFTLSRKGETRTISQFHLLNWPDHGVVKPSTLAEIVRFAHVENKANPIIVHCSAGIGRTGTFLTAFQAFAQKTTSIFNILKELRHPYTGRVGLVQNAEQYLTALRAAKILLS